MGKLETYELELSDKYSHNEKKKNLVSSATEDEVNISSSDNNNSSSSHQHVQTAVVLQQMAKAMCSDSSSSLSQYLGIVCSNLEAANVETTNVELDVVVEKTVYPCAVDKGKKPMLKAVSSGSSSSSGHERFELVPSGRSMHYDPYIEALIQSDDDLVSSEFEDLNDEEYTDARRKKKEALAARKSPTVQFNDNSDSSSSSSEIPPTEIPVAVQLEEDIPPSGLERTIPVHVEAEIHSDHPSGCAHPQHSDYEATDDEVFTPETSDASMDQQPRRKRRRGKVFNPKCNKQVIKFELGMKFETPTQFKEAVQSYALHNGVNIKWIRSCNERMEAICVTGCPWRIYGSLMQNQTTFIIKTFVDEHKCCRSKKNRQATVEWLANYYMESFERNLDWKVKHMALDFQSKFFIPLPRAKCYRVRTTSLERLRGSVEEHYALLGSYLAELRKVNPISLFSIVCDREHTGFFDGCRPIIGLDGCFLKTFLGGQVLTVVGTNGNNQMFPISWAVVEAIFVLGLDHALRKRVPHAEHRNYARHFYANWKKRYNGHYYKSLFWRVVRSMEEPDLRRTLSELEATSPQAHEALVAIGMNNFCQAYIGTTSKSDNVTNNISETFNSYILNASSKSIVDMLEDIRRMLM
ncbi:hypothetical protein Cni_G22493 [Canna indica]|uniref:Transposase MuDR plant domain-containing protein n=1 Tax=Canna indica TaxID=4628 RepID=A0AAQ3KSR1_9LILI|nr:hypothetical protein Cni_G22493 [Canna indica]